ncbi:MAG: RNA polymerase factor sigma-54 [Bacteroidales bacterium]|nr:RNA polymerase factor sigma-54 [Bacteroidales bacterium]
MKQTTVQRQTTHLAPQQVLIAKMVQATSDELDSLIVAETEKNVALELTDGNAGEESVSSEADTSANESSATDADDYEPQDGDLQDALNDYNDNYYEYNDLEVPNTQNQSPDDPDYSPLTNYRSDHSFREELLQQLEEMDLEEEDLFLARYLVDSLEDTGYLTRPLSDLVDDLAFNQMHETTEEELERVLVDVVQELEPTGVGARDLQECLLLQLEEKKATPEVQLAYDIISQAFEDFSARRYERLCSKFRVSAEELKKAQSVIAHLTPKPGGQSATSGMTETKASHVKPDFSIHCEDGELVVVLNEGYHHGVRISPDYLLMQERIQQDRSKSEDSRRGLTMIRESINAANQFLEALRQRRETLSRVIGAIARMQKEYFLQGGNTDALRPMVLQDVADRTGYDVSTISRVSNSKFIETDFGIIAVKELFSTAIKTSSGDSISNQAVQEALSELIEQEDKKSPLSDDALSAALTEKGYPVARRTVAKYRELLGFPTARLRREA